MDYAVETINLTKIFSDWWGRNKVRAVDDLNLKVRFNEVYGLLGPNGSGKTTTLKMLLQLLYPTKGKAIVLGGNSAEPKISERIGYMPEESYLYRYLTARETLHFYGRLFKLPAKVRKMRTESLLDMVGLKGVANRAVGTFSKGMARRIGLAQALINDPEILILDEPTTGLDPIGTRQIKDLILKLAERGKTILLCSHLLADVEDVCDRISILYGGKIQTEGNVKELLRQTNKKQITTGNLSDETLEKIKKLVESENTECLVSSPVEKLETFFINTVASAEEKQKATAGHFPQAHPQIAEFLAEAQKEKSKRSEILEKLVSQEPQQEVETETEKAQKPPEPEETKATDQSLLKNLTRATDTATNRHTEDVQKSEPVKTDTHHPAQKNDDILNQLSAEDEPEERSESHNDKQQEDDVPEEDSEK